MMLGRLENMDPVEEWRQKLHKRESIAGMIYGAVGIIGCLVTLVILILSYPRTANAAEVKTITIDGRTEQAVCEVEFSLPPIEVCKSESFLCRIMDGNISCEVTR